MSTASGTHITKVLKTYIESNPTTASLKDFAEKNEEFLLSNTNEPDLKRKWKKAFTEAAASLKIKTRNEEPDWMDLTTKVLKSFFQQKQRQQQPPPSDGSKPPSRTTTTTTSSQTTSTLLMPDQIRAYKEKFEAMEDEKKWRIGDSYVEDKMFEFGLSCTHEHACHSFVLDVEDEVWTKVFTTQELKIIKQHRCDLLPKLKQDVQEFFKLFKGKTDLNELRRVARAAGPYDQDEQFDVDWAQRMMIDLLTTYRYNVLERAAAMNSEKDLIIRVWKAIDYAFDDTGITATRNDFACTATAERLNANKPVSGQGQEGWTAAWKPDLLLVKQEIEHGCAEHGGFDNNVRKESFEKWLKLPKLMKDMFSRCCRKLDHEEAGTRKLKIVGFAHNHLRFQLLSMDSPEGYVCRISRSKEFEVPLSVALIPTQLIPILQVILKAKALVKVNIDLLEKGPSRVVCDEKDDDGPEMLVNEQERRPKLYLPAALNPSVECKNSKKKRKLSSEEEE